MTNVRRALIILILGVALLVLTDRLLRSPAEAPALTPGVERVQPTLALPAATEPPASYPRPQLPTPTEGPYPPPTPVPTTTPEGYVPPSR